MDPEPGRAERIRHRRKYAEGDLRWHSFYFRGPEGRTNLEAQNLVMFSHLAQGIDEATWMFHLRAGTIRAGFVVRYGMPGWRRKPSASNTVMTSHRGRRDK